MTNSIRSSAPDRPRWDFPRIVAGLGGGVFTILGCWALVAPGSFFRLVATFEPYNQHLIQDVGAFQIAIGLALAAAALSPRTDGITVALLGAAGGSIAHLVSHLVGIHLGGVPIIDIPGLALLALTLVAALTVHVRRRGEWSTRS